MFTGIIEATGKIKSLIRKKDRQTLTIYCKSLALQLKIGDSVAVNGICLTVTNRVLNDFEVDSVSETLSKTTIGNLKVGDLVNLERALKVEARLDGHVVTGHIDSKSTILDIRQNEGGILFEIVTPSLFSKYLVDKGSVAIDGISLTIARIHKSSFVVAIIPHTFEYTILKYKKAGDLVNIEFDVIGKYVENMLQNKKIGEWETISHEKIDWNFLKETGFLN